jgi:membrane fusion protein, multidrug efflux system
MAHRSVAGCLLLTFLCGLLSAGAEAQPASRGPPAVGVVRAERQQMTQVDEFIGRIQAVGRVALVARISAFLEQQLFVEGAEVKKGDLPLPPRAAPISGAGSG